MDAVSTTLAIQDLVIPGDCSSVIDRWRAVAGAMADRPVFASPGSRYSFADADRLSDIVAYRLLGELGEADAPVGIFAGHTAEALIGLLGVIKADRTVVVLDPHLPVDRLRLFADLAGIVTCVADAENVAAARELGAPLTGIISLETLLDASAPPSAAELGAIRPVRGGRDAVSIVFTSGSTGRPKGVLQTHDQLLNDALAHGERFRLDPDDRVALVLPYGFAAGLSLLFGAVLNGAGVWSYDPRDGGTRGFLSWLTENRLTTLHCTPHLLRSVVGVLPPTTVLDSVRLVSTVGEAVYGRDVEAIRPHLPATASFFNWTGPSEIGVLALHEITADAPLPAGTVAAGRPVAGREVRLLRDDGTIAGPGETGEIVTISYFLSGGYWQDDASNSVRFSTSSDGRRVCRQGDLGRFDDDGNLILLGRADSAVKVRGYLVEPQEVEAAILGSDGVKEVVVVTVSDPPAPTRLIAYVVPQSSLRTESAAALRRRLRGQLPEYMVPSSIMHVAALPRNERGKVDRAALPQVPRSSQSPAPTTQWEIVVADLWAEVLGLEFVGLDDDFMALGGDSLAAEEMLAIAGERFGVALVSTDVVEAPTLREFTRRVMLGSASLPSHPDVVTLRSAGTDTPVFCFAGSGALALTFVPLSRHIPNRAVYAFQARGLEKRALPDWTVESTARRYLEIIRIIQPRGPYILLGHSFGGLVALEIARVLTDAGESVDFVGLLDTYLPRSSGQQPTPTFEPMVQRPSTKAFDKARDFAQAQVRRVLPDGLPALRQWNRQARAYLAGAVPFSGQRQFDAFFDHGAITSRRYQVRPYAGRTMLVLADNNPDGPDAWRALLTGPHEFRTLACEHSSLLRDPHAASLATMLNAELDGLRP